MYSPSNSSSSVRLAHCTGNKNVLTSRRSFQKLLRYKVLRKNITNHSLTPCHYYVGTVTVRVLISGKGNRFSLLPLWGQPTVRFKECQRLLPRSVTWSSHIIQCCVVLFWRAQTPIWIPFSKFLSLVCLWTMSSVRSGILCASCARKSVGSAPRCSEMWQHFAIQY
jgi:hypothetical protein